MLLGILLVGNHSVEEFALAGVNRDDVAVGLLRKWLGDLGLLVGLAFLGLVHDLGNLTR